MSGIRKYNGYGDVMIYGGTRFEFGGSEAGNRFFCHLRANSNSKWDRHIFGRNSFLNFQGCFEFL